MLGVVTRDAKDMSAQPGSLEPDLFDARQELVHTLVPRTRKALIGDDQVQSLESGHAGQHVPVRGTEAIPVSRVIPNRDDDMAPRPSRRLRDRRGAKGMLVNEPTLCGQSFERSEGAHEKPRLPHKAFRAAVMLGAGLEAPEGQSLERGDIFQATGCGCSVVIRD